MLICGKLRGFGVRVWDLLDFAFFLKKKNSGPGPQFVDRARVAGPRVHRGPHSGRRLELTGG
jgi:hypothetical protein